MKPGSIMMASIAVVAMVLLSTASVIADEGNGGQAAAFLQMPLGARAAGMGSAFVSVSDDASAMYFNPGALYQVEGLAFSGMYSVMSVDRSLFGGSLVYSKEDHGSFGMMVTRFGISDIDGRDSRGNPTGMFDDSEMAVSFGYGRLLSPLLGVGGSIKYLRQSLADYGATGFAYDVGLHSRIDLENQFLTGVRLGASAANLGGELKWETASAHEDAVPSTLRFGAALDFNVRRLEILLALEGSQVSSEDFKLHTGVEARMFGLLLLRGGLDGSDYTFGISVERSQLRFDYAYSSDVLDEGATSRTGIEVAF